MSSARSRGKPARQLEGDRGASWPPQHHHNYYSRPTVPSVEDFGDMAEGGNPDASTKGLVQFFTTTPPPPTNYMSIPDDFGNSSEDDKWDKFKRKVLRHRYKTRKWRPPIIVLPDSAVSARTTGGHRYIAISIPIQHSPPAPLPVYDSVESAFHREVNSMFGTWKLPAHRPVTVLNPVAEDHESLSSSSPAPTVSEQSEQPTVLSYPSRRARSHSLSLLPSQEQCYTPRSVRDPSKSWSVEGARSVPQLSDPAPRRQSNEERYAFTPTTAETSAPGPSSKDISASPTSKDTHVAEPSTSTVLKNPVITLTLPARKSSRRGKRLDSIALETMENIISSRKGSSRNSNDTNGDGDGGGLSSGDRARGSFAASIDTTGYSPQLFKAQTATAYQSVPIVVRPSSVHVASPLDLNAPELHAGGKVTDHSFQKSPPAGPPPPSLSAMGESQSRKRSVREKKQRGAENMRAQTGYKGKEKELVSKPFTPDLPVTSPKMVEDPFPGPYRHHQPEDTSSIPPASSMSSLATSSGSTRERSAQSYTRRKQGREEREARYIAKALAEEKETLESLPREELIQRYEALREQRVYEREKRLRRLERSRDTWIRAVPVLLRDLNGLLREQRRILEGATLAYAFPTPAGPLEQQHEHRRRRRSRSVEISSGSLSDGGVDPLVTRRSQSLHSSSESRPGHRSSGLSSG
ncbi:hypothetical protein E0Z10_g8611 [Xylaria hypoxylon]|uniref:Uncharacterized protein n=1 Tax=Xylaria hypoxylon TaxID=37992 RepID=A0A4Z0YMG3_9PEZI|nr:hypothetical protein E0Z10_g8611 [Xylaria hypoxylon]